MFCSVIIPTIGRNSVGRAIHSILDQPFTEDEVEVIVVNDSGRPLPFASWQQLPNVQLVTTNRRERSVARNTGAAMAQGRYLYFLDDDDWLLPGALKIFWQLAHQRPQAVWLYGGIRVVDEMGTILGEVNSGLNGNCLAQIMGGAWAPIQASFIKAASFFEVGGYNPTICGTEDLDLCRRLAAHGEFANSPVTVACLLRGATWNTSTDYMRGPEDNRRSREAVLSQPQIFSRLRESCDSPYWSGRTLHNFLSAIVFNWRCHQWTDSCSRALFGLVWAVLAGPRILSADFWAGLKADHPPDTLYFIIKAQEEQDQKILNGYA